MTEPIHPALSGLLPSTQLAPAAEETHDIIPNPAQSGWSPYAAKDAAQYASRQVLRGRTPGERRTARRRGGEFLS